MNDRELSLLTDLKDKWQVEANDKSTSDDYDYFSHGQASGLVHAASDLEDLIELIANSDPNDPMNVFEQTETPSGGSE